MLTARVGFVIFVENLLKDTNYAHFQVHSSSLESSLIGHALAITANNRAAVLNHNSSLPGKCY